MYANECNTTFSMRASFMTDTYGEICEKKIDAWTKTYRS